MHCWATSSPAAFCLPEFLKSIVFDSRVLKPSGTYAVLIQNTASKEKLEGLKGSNIDESYRAAIPKDLLNPNKQSI